MFYPGNLKLNTMNYEEIKQLGEKQLSDLFEIIECEEIIKKRMVVAFIEGFVQGELHQINRAAQRLQEA